MAIYSTLENKAAAFKLYFKESLFNLDSNNSRVRVLVLIILLLS